MLMKEPRIDAFNVETALAAWLFTRNRKHRGIADEGEPLPDDPDYSRMRDLAHQLIGVLGTEVVLRETALKEYCNEQIKKDESKIAFWRNEFSKSSSPLGRDWIELFIMTYTDRVLELRGLLADDCSPVQP